jgi:hypothetical protein
VSKKPDIEANWEGPFSWPAFHAENQLPPIPDHSGVYLMTAEYGQHYLIYAAGIPALLEV